MQSCPQCGGSIQETDRYCSSCGLSQSGTPKRRFPLRRFLIFCLCLFLLLSTLYTLHDFLVSAPDKIVEAVREESEVPLLGKVYDQRLGKTWEYSEGMIRHYVAYNQEGNRLTICLDQETGELKGYGAALPAAKSVNLTLEEARQTAEALVLQIPFFTDPTIKYKEGFLVNNGPETEQYYAFHWLAEDPDTGAVLLRQILIGVHPENGEIIYLLIEDGGEVTIPTHPTILKEEARSLALATLQGQLQRPKLIDDVLYVYKENGIQRLLWMMVYEESAWRALSQRVYVELDAQTGKILHTTF